MNMKRLLAVFFAGTGLIAMPLAAQSLAPSAAVPDADGTIGTGEYSWKTEQKGAFLYFSLSADGSVLYAAVDSPAPGWAAVGLGSKGMNGAFMVLASDDGTKQEISEQTGKMFSHSVNSEKILTAGAVKQSGGRTVLEFAVPAAQFVKNGKIDAIAAWAKKTSFTTKHSNRLSLTVPVQN